MRSFHLFFIGVACAEETCSDGTCAQDEATLLQMKGLRQNKLLQEPDADGVLNRDTQCWHGNQCGGQGGECPSGYCGDGGVCCRANWNAINGQEELECGATGYGIEGMHTCQPRLLNEGQQCWHGNQCGGQGGRCPDYCGARGVCCRANWTPQNDKEREECGENGHGNNGMHQCHLPPRPYIPVAEGMKCPHNHGDRLFRSPESGSDDVSLADCFDLCENTAGCNHYSWGPWEGGNVCMGCTSLTNAQEHEPFTTYDMPGLTRYTIDGCGRDGDNLQDGSDGSLTGYADPEATADVRCCSLDGSDGVSQGFEGGEDYFRPGASTPHSTGCAFGKTFLEARDLCDARGMRLCAPHEIDVTCGSGCWHNHNAVWVDVPTVGVTIDGCSTDNSNSQAANYPGSDDSQAEIPSAQQIIGDMAAVRCCSHNGNSCESNVGDADGVGGAGCNDAVTFVEAQRICSEDNKRLCSADEMNTCCGSGCWYNHFSVWTSSGL